MTDATHATLTVRATGIIDIYNSPGHSNSDTRTWTHQTDFRCGCNLIERPAGRTTTSTRSLKKISNKTPATKTPATTRTPQHNLLCTCLAPRGPRPNLCNTRATTIWRPSTGWPSRQEVCRGPKPCPPPSTAPSDRPLLDCLPNHQQQTVNNKTSTDGRSDHHSDCRISWSCCGSTVGSPSGSKPLNASVILTRINVP
jgi:hypothetical protein